MNKGIVRLIAAGVAVGVLIATRKKVRVSRMLTKNFYSDEFLQSAVFAPINDYEPTVREWGKLGRLAFVLQELRDTINRPVIVTGGVRLSHDIVDPKTGRNHYQTLVFHKYEPEPDSQHHDFTAADVRGVHGNDTKRLYSAAKVNKNVRQVIAYYTKDGVLKRLHIGVTYPGLKPLGSNRVLSHTDGVSGYVKAY